MWGLLTWGAGCCVTQVFSKAMMSDSTTITLPHWQTYRVTLMSGTSVWAFPRWDHPILPVGSGISIHPSGLTLTWRLLVKLWTCEACGTCRTSVRLFVCLVMLLFHCWSMMWINSAHLMQDKDRSPLLWSQIKSNWPWVDSKYYAAIITSRALDGDLCLF